MIKTCTKCKIEKEISCFSKQKKCKDGHRSICKECSKQYLHDWKILNVEKINQYMELNKVRFKKKNAEYRKNNREKEKQRLKKYYINNKQTISAKIKNGFYNIDEPKRKENRTKWQSENKYRIKEVNHFYYIKNRTIILSRNKNWNSKNKGKINEIKRNYFFRNPQQKIKQRISTSIYKSLKARNCTKESLKSFVTILPYSPSELIAHLELQFELGMTWTNYGLWHIDHIIPDSWFQYSSIDDDEFKQSWALCNLQPKWKKENLEKGNRYVG